MQNTVSAKKAAQWQQPTTSFVSSVHKQHAAQMCFHSIMGRPTIHMLLINNTQTRI
jgi:hypothetical protein